MQARRRLECGGRRRDLRPVSPRRVYATACVGQCDLVVGVVIAAAAQGPGETRRAPVIEVDGTPFRELNKNGTLDPYEDRRAPIANRVSDLLARTTMEEKAGLMISRLARGIHGPRLLTNHNH
jgi:hypothetical protein